MKKKFTLFIASMLMAIALYEPAAAQLNARYYHPAVNQKGFPALQLGQGTNINVVYHRCYWRIHPDTPSTSLPAKYLKGIVTTYFVTLQSNVGQVTFDFNNVYTIDSVKYHGVKLPGTNIAWNTSRILQLTFPSAIAGAGTLDSLTIHYRGTPPAVNGEAIGYQRGGSGSNNYIYTLSESYEDRDWWPCKHDMTDKIDSMDIQVSVPSAFWVATNGKLTDSAISGSNRVFTFKHRYPIASYLVALGVAKYARYYRQPVNIGGVNVPVVYNIFPGKSQGKINSILSALDLSRTELIEFSNKYGDYPFKNEKHGYYEFGYGGGMEHQTFSGMGGSALTSWSAIAHELSHQWFGDKVTCSTWHDLWINEGFARFNEVLAAELISGLTNPVTYLGSIKSAARNVTTTPVYINNISSSNTIWTGANSTAVYERGCMVVSMLRALLGDTRFFQASRDFLNDPALSYNAAATADVERNYENQFGLDLSHFFNAWIYGYGNPAYTVNWSTNGNNITLQLNQTRSAGSSVSYFAMPVVLKVSNNNNSQSILLTVYDRGDSVFVAGNGAGAGTAGNSISFNLPFAPSTVSFDPNNATMATGITVQVPGFAGRSMGRGERKQERIVLYPNPASDELVISRSGDVLSYTVQFLDMNGKMIQSNQVSNQVERIDTRRLKSGVYVVKIIENGAVIIKEKLIIQH